jgi:hypothetical protein
VNISNISAVILALVLGGSLNASQLETFAIYNSANSFAPAGGTFSDGGSFYGTFTLDLSQIAKLGAGGQLSLSSWDITTTTGTNFSGTEYSSSPVETGYVTVIPVDVGGLLGTVDEDVIQLTSQSGEFLGLFFLEPLGYFPGGVVQLAEEGDQGSSGPFSRTDITGSAMALDPEPTPEPTTQSTLPGGVAVFFFLWARARRATRPARL